MNRDVPNEEIVASRNLQFRYSDGRKEAVAVVIGKPMLALPPDTWHCSFSIKGQSFEENGFTAGVDAVQALDGTLSSISSILSALSRENKGEFFFLGEPGHEFRAST